MTATLVSDGRGGLALDALFDDVEPAELEAALAGPQPADVPYHCLLVRTAESVVLVDTGLGSAEHPFGGSGGGLWAELDRHGVARDAVDVVVVTHGHLDHIGGLTRDGAPAFPRARYVMARLDWELYTSEDSLAQMSALAAGPAREHLPPLAEAGPEWGQGLDRDPETGIATRRALLARASEQGIPVAAAHLETVFRVEPDGPAFRLTPL